MYSTVDSRITGFEFHPEFEKIRSRSVKKLKSGLFRERTTNNYRNI